MSTQTTLFKIEGNVAPRSMVREISTTADYLRKVDLSLIRIRPDNFNARIKPEGMSEEDWDIALKIPELADLIYVNNGPATNILGDFHVDGFFYQTDGERRIRALKYLISTERDVYPNGIPVSVVTVAINPPGTTDLDRKKKMYFANQNMPLTAMQTAHYYNSFRSEPFNMSVEQIAKEFRVTRQTIYNHIEATKLPQEQQDKIDSGELKMTNVLNETRKEKKKLETAIVDVDSGEILTEAQERRIKEEEEKEAKVRGDEDEFEQQDNSVNFQGSMAMPHGIDSGSMVVAKDSVYMQNQKRMAILQFVNRYEVLMENAAKLIVADKPSDEDDPDRKPLLVERRLNHVLDRLQDEYNVTVK